jgi:hypothetical protein
MNYALDTELAREGSGNTGGRIQETGPYKGVIEWAREKVNANNTSMIEIKFLSVDNQYANITIYTKNAAGEQLHGMSQIHALMACLKVRSMNAVPGEVEAFDFDLGQMTKQQSSVLLELANKPIGMLLQKEFYTNGKGEQKDQMNLFAPFTSDTEQVSKEVLDNKGESEMLVKLVESVKDKYRNNVKPINSAPSYQAQEPAPVDDFEDSIPF